MTKQDKQMTLSDFARYVNMALDKSENGGKEPVIVTLHGRDAGKRAFVNIRFVGRGKKEDGEENEIRIETTKKINLEQHISRDIPRKPLVKTHPTANGSSAKEVRCGKCNAELRRKDSYCAHCGQRVGH